ncbi:hypothetical protein T440DRAFT_506006 [Plenodomus tracheiphilus IPT5]|uniref:ribonuclease T1 n=1 Tax=Plenodomus tracheiphilus IPT5 TaxID=1408161 RepID=A0A6A7BCY9_9PLEO|nr:hypothetical protein T440DRAFT_506006 [Plenodomus tracheiphilus IPT5]
MKFTTALLISLATLSAATPLPLALNTKSALIPRADIVSVTCPMVNGNGNGQVTYSVANIEEAFTIGSGTLRPPPHLIKGSNGKEYPAYYGNYQNIALPADCTAPDIYDQQEFPILRGKVAFGEQSNPGPDRVIFARKNDGNFVYCYTVYHQDGSGDFAQFPQQSWRYEFIENASKQIEWSLHILAATKLQLFASHVCPGDGGGFHTDS